jgi:hypothetical protein
MGGGGGRIGEVPVSIGFLPFKLIKRSPVRKKTGHGVGREGKLEKEGALFMSMLPCRWKAEETRP